MKTIATWSFSRLMDFESCPYKAWLKHAERVPDTRPKEAADRGTMIHTMAEDFLNDKIKKLPQELAKFSDEFESIKKRRDKLALEDEWGFTRSWEPCDYNAKDVWGRMKADCVLNEGDRGVVIDFKTGKKFGNEIKHGEQLQVYALAAFIRHPEWESITAELWYLDVNELTPIDITRKLALDRYLRVFDKRFRKMTDAKEFKPNPNIYSCMYCPYGNVDGTGHCDKQVKNQQATAKFYQRLHGGKKS